MSRPESTPIQVDSTPRLTIAELEQLSDIVNKSDILIGKRPDFDYMDTGKVLFRCQSNNNKKLPQWKLVLVTDKDVDSRRITIFDPALGEEQLTENEYSLMNLFTIENYEWVIGRLDLQKGGQNVSV